MWSFSGKRTADRFRGNGFEAFWVRPDFLRSGANRLRRDQRFAELKPSQARIFESTLLRPSFLNLQRSRAARRQALQKIWRAQLFPSNFPWDSQDECLPPQDAFRVDLPQQNRQIEQGFDLRYIFLENFFPHVREYWNKNKFHLALKFPRAWAPHPQNALIQNYRNKEFQAG